MKAIPYFSFLLLISLSSISLSFAAEEQDIKPQVEKMLAEIKQAGSYKPLLKHVDWNAAYSRLSDSKRKELRVASAAELEEEMKLEFERPAVVLERPWREKEGALKPQERELMQPQFDLQIAQVASRWADFNKKLKTSDYQIISSQIEEKSGKSFARVVLKDKSHGESLPWKLSLVSADKDWMIVDISLIGLGFK